MLKQSVNPIYPV